MLVFEETPAHRTVISCLAASARENDPILEGSHKTEEWESCSAIAFGQLCSWTMRATIAYIYVMRLSCLEYALQIPFYHQRLNKRIECTFLQQHVVLRVWGWKYRFQTTTASELGLNLQTVEEGAQTSQGHHSGLCFSRWNLLESYRGLVLPLLFFSLNMLRECFVFLKKIHFWDGHCGWSRRDRISTSSTAFGGTSNCLAV